MILYSTKTIANLLTFGPKIEATLRSAYKLKIANVTENGHVLIHVLNLGELDRKSITRTTEGTKRHITSKVYDFCSVVSNIRLLLVSIRMYLLHFHLKPTVAQSKHVQ